MAYSGQSQKLPRYPFHSSDQSSQPMRKATSAPLMSWRAGMRSGSSGRRGS